MAILSLDQAMSVVASAATARHGEVLSKAFWLLDERARASTMSELEAAEYLKRAVAASTSVDLCVDLLAPLICRHTTVGKTARAAIATLRLDKPRSPTAPGACSYAANIANYINANIALHRASKKLANTSNAQSLVDEIKKRLYAAPCKSCVACMSRKKMWP